MAPELAPEVAHLGVEASFEAKAALDAAVTKLAAVLVGKLRVAAVVA